ncbi:MAG: non-canonical purine NTP pyrophosphatase [Oceanospirillales bacterium LUC14_002_19_P2]|nr:MAG: non-canonical purine NTP pyrophosphatase [Oceanospirillales bacterium LUC14_002_19_P2]
MSSEIRQIVLATGNHGKLAEFQHLLGAHNIKMLTQKQFGVTGVEETGLTFVENAILKARAAAEASGLPVIADDSGLEVDALNGAPGIYSSRYSGENASDADNIEKLLKALQGLPVSERTARFQCLLVYLRHANDPTPLICQGTWEGYIIEEPRGDHGFGYDPVFFVPGMHSTAAELTPEQKNGLSHRAMAMRQLAEKLTA